MKSFHWQKSWRICKFREYVMEYFVANESHLTTRKGQRPQHASFCHKTLVWIYFKLCSCGHPGLLKKETQRAKQQIILKGNVLPSRCEKLNLMRVTDLISFFLEKSTFLFTWRLLNGHFKFLPIVVAFKNASHSIHKTFIDSKQKEFVALQQHSCVRDHKWKMKKKNEKMYVDKVRIWTFTSLIS